MAGDWLWRAGDEAGSRTQLEAAAAVVAGLGDPAVLAYAEGHRWPGPARPLTPRKAEIVRLVAAGLPNKEIARRLSISERTVDAHLEQVRNRLGLHSRAQIAAWAVARGVVER